MRTLSVISLATSAVALLLAIFSCRAAHDQAAMAVSEREQALIQHYQPQFDRIYADFRVPIPDSARHPRHIEDLVDPLLRLAEPTTRPASGGG